MIFLHTADERIGSGGERKTAERYFTLDEKYLHTKFLETYKGLTGKEFDPGANEGEAGNLMQLIAKYLLKKESFIKNPLLTESPRPDKGLLIMGNPGTGKTSILSSFKKTFEEEEIEFELIRERISTPGNGPTNWTEPGKPLSRRYCLLKGKKKAIRTAGEPIEYPEYRAKVEYSDGSLFDLKIIKADDVVTEYQRYLKEQSNEFQNLNNPRGRAIHVIDDVLSERTANHYGTELEAITKILEDMEYRAVPFILTCNKIGDVNNTLNVFKARYGTRAYDRIFACLNIVNLKGNSLRG